MGAGKRRAYCDRIQFIKIGDKFGSSDECAPEEKGKEKEADIV